MFERELAQMEKGHLLRRPITLTASEACRVQVAEKSLLLMCSNDYLGLSHHPGLAEAARAALDRYGFGSGASRLVSGTSPLHDELEMRIARFKATESAILFNSGYAANTGIIPALAGDGDLILSDSLNHASIIDGCRLSRAKVLIYRHRDMDHLEDLLRQKSQIGRRLIVTDGVFSMDGDIAPLPDLVLLSERYDALLMVDDAHGTGVLGRTGKGTAEHFGLEGRIPIQMGTLGKALGSFGAFVAGDNGLIRYLVNRSRSYIFSTSLPPSVCAASIAAMDVVEQEPGRRQRLWENRRRLTDGLTALGIGVNSSETPIIPVLIGSSEKALAAGQRLFDAGVFASAIRPPTVADGTARIRMTVTAVHSEHDIDTALAAVRQCRDEGLIE